MIGIVYICTGNYTIFWEDFHKSAQKNLFPGTKKKYFVFTDQPFRFFFIPNVIPVYIKKSPWPYSTLFRYKYILKKRTSLSKCEYIFFFNANVEFKKIISEDFLPKYDKKYIAVKHPGFYNKHRSEFTYEINPNSTAYIPSDQGEIYFMGGVNGGRAEEYLEMCKILKKNIELDLSNGIIAIWHDESHLNRFFMTNIDKLQLYEPEYGYPEGWNLPFDVKILIRDKEKYGGHYNLRNT